MSSVKSCEYVSLAIVQAKRATKEDEEKNYPEAVLFYLKAVNTFMLAIKCEEKEERRKLLRGKVESLLSRAEKVKSYLSHQLYDGTFNEKGEREGMGCCYTDSTKTQKVYEGEWKKGTKHGKGTYYFSNGDEYEGFFFDNYFHGKGRYRFHDSSFHHSRSSLEGIWTLQEIKNDRLYFDFYSPEQPNQKKRIICLHQEPNNEGLIEQIIDEEKEEQKINEIQTILKEKEEENEKIKVKEDEEEKVLSFLKSCGLENYYSNFQRERVLFEDLIYLEDDEELEELIPKKFHRKRFLRRIIQELKDNNNKDDSDDNEPVC